MKKLVAEFAKFIDRGNVLDLAVGVVIGGAFTSIVNSAVNDVIMPIIGVLVGGLNFEAITIPLIGDAQILIGNFIQAIINFLIIAFVVFIVIKAVNQSKERLEKLNLLKKEKEEKPVEVPIEPEDIKLLKSIEKELKKSNKAAK